MHPICSKRILRGLALCGATVLAPAWALEAPAPSAEALRTLAIAHEHGEGVERNPEQARQLYCQSARLGDAQAQYNLGWMYANGRGGAREAVRFGHPSGTLRVGAQAKQVDGQWTVTKAIMSRSARVLMEGWVRVPGDTL